jgi:hypothetical protein
MTDEFTDALKELGFADEREWSRMMSAVNLTDPLIALRFENWKLNDGSKTGLQRLLDTDKPAPVVPPKPMLMPRALPACAMCTAGIPKNEIRYTRAMMNRANVVLCIKINP